MIMRAIIIVLLLASSSFALGKYGGSAQIATMINVGNLNAAQQQTAANVFDLVLTTVGRTSVSQVNADATTWKGLGGNTFWAHNNSIFTYKTGKEYNDCNSDETLYAHYTDCEPSCGVDDRISNATGSFYFMDLDTDWGAQLVTWYNQYNSSHDGIMLDDGSSTIDCETYLDPDCPYGHSAANYKTNKDIVLEYVKAQLSGKTVIYNGFRSWVSDNDYAAGLDGGLIENCIISTATDPDKEPTNHAWISADVDGIFDATAAGKITLCLPKDESGAIFTNAQRLFAFAAYLLAQSPTYSYYMVFTSLDFQANWYPEYGIDIGTPTGSPTTMADLENEDGLFVRNYTKGIVVLNDTEGAIDYTMPACMLSFSVTGGGDIESDGLLPGTLSTSPECGTVSVASGTAKIYKYKNAFLTGTGTYLITAEGTPVLK